MHCLEAASRLCDENTWCADFASEHTGVGKYPRVSYNLVNF